MGTINEGDQPYDDHHNTPPRVNHLVHDSLGDPAICGDSTHNHPPAEGAMDRFAELPRPTAHDPFQWVPPVPLVESQPWRPEPMTVAGAVEELSNALRLGTDVPSSSVALRLVLDELAERMAEDVALSESVEATGLQYFFPNGDHVTNVANWAAEGYSGDQSTLNLRVLSAHLTTALDGITAELNRRLASGR